MLITYLQLVFIYKWRFPTCFVQIIFFITQYSFPWIIILLCFSAPVAYRAWKSSTSSHVQWKRSMRHLSKVITYSLCTALTARNSFSSFWFHTIPLLSIQLSILLLNSGSLGELYSFSLATHAVIVKWLTAETHCPAKFRISSSETNKISTRWTI